MLLFMYYFISSVFVLFLLLCVFVCFFLIISRKIKSTINVRASIKKKKVIRFSVENKCLVYLKKYKTVLHSKKKKK